MRTTEQAGKLVGSLKWTHVIITYIVSDTGEVYVEHSVVTDPKQYVEHRKRDGTEIVSVKEIESDESRGSCPVCHKPFRLGEIIYNTSMTKHTLVFLERHLGYFGERYEGEDSLDIHEQLRYIVHATHVSVEMVECYREGQRLWDAGMKLCRDVKSQLWKL